jgi:hypothetical protein
MISEEQASLLAEAKAQEDFPEYQSGPVLSASEEDGCWYIHLRLYHHQQRTPVDVCYGVYRSGRANVATLFDAVPARVMSDDELATQCAADHLAHDYAAISILDVSIADHNADRWQIEVYFCRLLDRSTAEASYAVWHENGQFHARRTALDEVTKGYVRRPSAPMKYHHHCAKAHHTKHTREHS